MSLPEWIRELKGQHIEVHEPYSNDDVCEDCEELWPCPTIRLIEYIEQQDAENQRLREEIDKAQAVAISARVYLGDENERNAKQLQTDLDRFQQRGAFRATRTSDGDEGA